MKLLLTSDGSPAALAAVRYVVKTAPEWRSLAIELLNVQPPLSGTASALAGGGAVKDHHKAEGEAALREAKALLDAAGLKYAAHVAVGEVAETIAAYARDAGVDQIVMGTRGNGPLGSLILGSTTTRVIELAAQPVTVAK